MSKILIFAKSKESILFLKKLSEEFFYLGEFFILYEDDEVKNSIENRDNFKFYKISFYAYKFYEEFFYKELNKIFILIRNKKEALFVLDLVKKRDIPSLFVDFWGDVVVDRNNIDVIHVNELLVNKIIDYVPNIPLFARDIGLGEGEILEIEVPPHSSFAYRRVNSVNKKDARIVAIYRNSKLKLIDNSTLILPNDKLLIIGEPSAIKDMFVQIKKDIGVFPQPFGQNIYLLIDMKHMKQEEISKLLKTALYLHKNLNNKRLIIKIINPTISAQIYKLYKFNHISIKTDFYENNYIKMLKKDIVKYNVGLIITNNLFFFKYKEDFFNFRLPIFKSGIESIKKCTKMDIVIEDNIRSLVPIIFDLTYQIKKPLYFIDGDPEQSYDDLIDYIKNFKNSFNFKDIFFVKTEQNPILHIRKEYNICLIVPFDKIPASKFYRVIFPKMSESYLFLNKFNQILLPITTHTKDKK